MSPFTATPARQLQPLRPAPSLPAIATAPTARAAATVLVDHLAALGLMPSVYLERGGRLRCEAARGYWQVFDGMPLTAGTIGRTFRTGREAIVLDVSEHPDHLATVTEVRSEVALPLRADGRVVGVLNVESRRPLDLRAVDHIRRCGSLLEEALQALGHRDRPSAAQRLARRAARLASLTTVHDIVEEALESASVVSGLSSAMLVLREGEGDPHMCAASGDLRDVLGHLRPGDLAAMARWVEHGTSSYTVGDAGGLGFAGHHVLRAAGARSLIVLRLEASGEPLGFMVLADRQERRLPTEEVELLELLAVQVAAGLRIASAVAELRERAATDPLTGLGHHATFHAALAARRAAPPAEMRTALLLVDLDGFKGLNDANGHPAGDEVLRATADLLRDSLPPGAGAFRIGGDEFAVLASVGAHTDAARLARAIRGAARARLGLTVSVGVAVDVLGESDAELVERADAALYRVKRRGRDGVAMARVPAGTRQASLF